LAHDERYLTKKGQSVIEWIVGIIIGLGIIYFLATKFESLKNEPTEKLYETLKDENRINFWFNAIRELLSRNEDLIYLNNRLLDGMQSNKLRERAICYQAFKEIFPAKAEELAYKPHKAPEQEMLNKLAVIRTKG
jgi:hypothetical protein